MDWYRRLPALDLGLTTCAVRSATLSYPSRGGPCFFAIHDKRCEQDESMGCAHAHIALSTPGSEVGQGIMVMLRLSRISGLPLLVGRGPPDC